MTASMGLNVLSKTIIRNIVRGPLRVSCCRYMCKNASTTSDHTNSNYSKTQDSGSEQTEHGGDEQTEYEVKLRILNSSLPYVHKHGWTQNALAAGAEAAGLPGVAHGLFPHGGIELIFHFYADCNRKLAEHCAEQLKQQKCADKSGSIKSQPNITSFIREALETRLRMIIPYMDKWPQALAIMTLPQNAPKSISYLINLTDEIWYHAGDASTDFNWYTKRVSLGVLYKSTEVYMIQDKSEDFIDSWNFLDRRLEDLKNAGKLLRNSQQTASVLQEACRGLYIVGRNIIGANYKAK